MSVSARGTSQIVGEDAYGPGDRMRGEYSPEQPHEHVEGRTSGWYWLIIGGGPCKGNPYNGNVFAAGGHLAVFSFREEAQACLDCRVPGEGWQVREFGAGELVSMLYGPWNTFGSVALDPPAEVADRTVDGLVAVERKEFAGQLVRRGYPGERLPSDGPSAATRPQPIQGG